VVRPEDLLPDAFKKAVAVAFREVVHFALEPDVHRLEIVQIECRHFVCNDTEKVALRLCALHPAACRPDSRRRYCFSASCLFFGVFGEEVDDEGADLAGICSGAAAAFPADEPPDTLKNCS